MTIGRPKAVVVLSAEERAQLSALAASRSLPHALVAPARLVLWAAAGESNTAIAGACPSIAGAVPRSRCSLRLG